MKKWLLLITGWFFVGLAVLGVFLPLLPTTPFLLISAACFYKSSPRFYEWLLNNRYLGKYITNYRDKKGMPLKAKVYTILLLNAGIAYSVFLFKDVLYISVLLVIIAVAVSTHLILMKTIIENE